MHAIQKILLFKVILHYITSSSPAWTTCDPVSNRQTHTPERGREKLYFLTNLRLFASFELLGLEYNIEVESFPDVLKALLSSPCEEDEWTSGQDGTSTCEGKTGVNTLLQILYYLTVLSRHIYSIVLSGFRIENVVGSPWLQKFLICRSQFSFMHFPSRGSFSCYVILAFNVLNHFELVNVRDWRIV